LNPATHHGVGLRGLLSMKRFREATGKYGREWLIGRSTNLTSSKSRITSARTSAEVKVGEVSDR